MNFRKNHRIEWEREAAANSANKIQISSRGPLEAAAKRTKVMQMRPRSSSCIGPGNSVIGGGGRIDSSHWNGIVTLFGYQTFQRSSKLASNNVWRAARIGDREIEIERGGDFCWLHGTRKLGVTPRKRILPINCQSNLATQKILLFPVTTRLRLSIRLFLPRVPSMLSTLLFCLWQPALSFSSFSFLFFVLNEDGERVWRESWEILGSWEGRRCLPFLSGEGGGFYFPEKSGQILENNIGEGVLKIVFMHVYI